MVSGATSLRLRPPPERTPAVLYSLDGVAPQIGEGAWVAPSADLMGKVELGANASVWFNCVMRGDTDRLVVGEGSNVQDASVLHTDAGIELRIGKDCTIGHQVMLHGCTIGDNTLIGIGSVILNRAVIGANSLVAAGSHMLVNLSRGVLREANRTFAGLTVVHLTAEPETLANRLSGRGREDVETIRQRLQRSEKALPEGIDRIDISNDGSLAATVDAALAALYPARV